MLRQGVETKAVAEFLGVSSRQVAAIAAHITMGSYAEEPTTFNDTYTIEDLSSKSKILTTFEANQPSKKKVKSGILLGENRVIIESGV